MSSDEKSSSGEKDIILEKLTKIEATINKLKEFHMGKETTSVFKGPSEHEAQFRRLNNCLGNLERIEKKIDTLQATVNKLKK